MYKGNILNTKNGFITGWIRKNQSDDSVYIKVKTQKKIIRRLKANRKLKNDFDSKIGAHGFRLSIENLLASGVKNNVQILSDDEKFKFKLISIKHLAENLNSKMDSKKRVINKSNIFLIGGKPNSGKTTFAEALHNKLPGSYVLRLDSLFKNDMYPSNTNSAILKYVDSPMFNREDFIRLFIDEYLPLIPFNETGNIIIDGWLLNSDWIRKKMVQIFNIYGFPTYVELDDYVIKYKSKRFQGDGNTEAFIKHFKSLRLADLSPKTTYQCYEDLGQVAKNSKSAEKIEKAEIPDLTGKVVLDIGCNAGVMSNTFAKSGAKRVYGIDVRRVSVAVASQYNNTFYQSPNLSFHHIDVYDFKAEEKLDVVYASSVFHYFRERQQRFFDYMHASMSEDGLLIIEIEIYEEKENEAFTYKYKRVVDDTPCYFPNQLMIDKMLEGRFSIKSKKLSVNQKGSKLNRYFFHMNKM